MASLADQAEMASDATLDPRISAALVRVAYAVTSETQPDRHVDTEAWRRWANRRSFAHDLLMDSTPHVERTRHILAAFSSVIDQYQAGGAASVVDADIEAAVSDAWNALAGV